MQEESMDTRSSPVILATWEHLYLARNTRSMVPTAVLGTTYISLHLIYSSVIKSHFGNDFISFLHHRSAVEWAFHSR
jgi:hypothetical protein